MNSRGAFYQVDSYTSIPEIIPMATRKREKTKILVASNQYQNQIKRSEDVISGSEIFLLGIVKRLGAWTSHHCLLILEHIGGSVFSMIGHL